MIDETVLEDLLAQIAAEIPIPPGGPAHVLDALAVGAKPNRNRRSHFPKPLLVAAAVLAIGLIAVLGAARLVEHAGGVGEVLVAGPVRVRGKCVGRHLDEIARTAAGRQPADPRRCRRRHRSHFE